MTLTTQGILDELCRNHFYFVSILYLGDRLVLVQTEFWLFDLSCASLADITPWELPRDKRGEVGGYKVDKRSRTG